ncbi:MAG: tRNA 2-thiocytidine(32) synthetase TtcA [Peptococcaceae bacterium]|nr:tRNA 2-thiocytidine(32) synthetase TtcA [Peptococcaceae bacterium]
MRNRHSWFLTRVKRAIKDYDMIPRGAKILVSVSGGKDSISLLYILFLLQHYSHLDFQLEAVHINLGWGEVDTGPLEALCTKLDVPLYLKSYPVASIIQKRGEKSPCALCAKLRSGIVNSIALDVGAGLVATGHHLDDVVETFFLNMIFAGQLKTFLPKTYLSNTGLTLIRPLVYVTEKTLASLREKEGLPLIHNPCPYNGNTKREEMKDLVSSITQRYPDFYDKFLTSLQNVSFENLWKQR